jgi:BirA family biotin operon repressor/biotin-[acetyl-CoA-carboxylase] ligase
MPERNILLALLLQELADMLDSFAEQGFLALRAEWESYHRFQNCQVKFLLPDGSTILGKVLGVTEDGALRVETDLGVKIFNAGEISMRAL